MKCGTAVLWQKLDQLVEGQSTEDAEQHGQFLARIDAVGQHLGMVFHRLMEGRRRLRIHVNQREVEPSDPFFGNEPATLRLARTTLSFNGESIIVEPFVLPHLSKLTPQLHAQAAGVRGWNAHQGFYVYRNERLLVPEIGSASVGRRTMPTNSRASSWTFRTRSISNGTSMSRNRKQVRRQRCARSCGESPSAREATQSASTLIAAPS